MIEQINNFAGFNLAAILFALIGGTIFFIVFHFVLWPIISRLLNPIVAAIINVIEFFNVFKKDKNSESSKTSDSKESFISNSISSITDWLSKNLILKTIFLILTPFIILNYLYYLIH